MRHCARCVLPETHETIEFDGEGVCNICRQAEKKHAEVDWDARGEMLRGLVAEHRGRGLYDCIIPYSGGKDSAYQLWYAVVRLGLKPLVVRFDHGGFRPLVQTNNDLAFGRLGVDVLQFSPNKRVVRKLMLASLRESGDFCWHCHTGVFGYVMQTSVRFGIPLVIFGESPAEYRAYTSFDEIRELERGLFDGMINLGIDNERMLSLLDGEADRRDLAPYEFPSRDLLERAGTRGIWLGNYVKWDTRENVAVIKRELGWRGQRVEGIPPEYDYEKIECMWQGVRDFCKFIKRGHGRTNHLACIDIRSGRMDRARGMELSALYDGLRPASLDLFLETLGIGEDEFVAEVSRHAHPKWRFDPASVRRGEPLADAGGWKP